MHEVSLCKKGKSDTSLFYKTAWERIRKANRGSYEVELGWNNKIQEVNGTS